jgi:hypothetical protein
MLGTDREYLMQVRELPDGAWQGLGSFRGPTDCGASLAYRDIRVGGDGLARLTKLPRFRPGELRRQQRILDNMPTRVISSEEAARLRRRAQ